MEEKESQARALLDKTNRQFNECNALYHAAAQRCGLSDAAFWTLYALVTSCEPLTQNRIAADWGIPKQTLNSAVAAMVKKGPAGALPGKRSPQRKDRDPDRRGPCAGRAHRRAGHRRRGKGHPRLWPCKRRGNGTVWRSGIWNACSGSLKR